MSFIPLNYQTIAPAILYCLLSLHYILYPSLTLFCIELQFVVIEFEALQIEDLKVRSTKFGD